MKLKRHSIKGIKFYHREGMSDLKTFEEVIGANVYQQRGMKIEPGQHWMDCGGNVGAFSLLAISKGAKATIYEPDPFNCEMIEKNLKLNGFKADIKQAALVHDDIKSVHLFIGNNGNVWRNSIVKKWNDKGIKVPALNFEVEAKGKDCCKMDIEGAEMPILENTSAVFDRLVYEWSFDIDPSLKRLWSLIDRQKNIYRIECAWKQICYESREHEVWPKNWFPACTNLFCFR